MSRRMQQEMQVKSVNRQDRIMPGTVLEVTVLASSRTTSGTDSSPIRKGQRTKRILCHCKRTSERVKRDHKNNVNGVRIWRERSRVLVVTSLIMYEFGTGDIITIHIFLEQYGVHMEF